MPRCPWPFRAAAVAVAALCGARSANAQSSHEPARGATTAEVIGGNILIGGVVAAAKALFSDADPLRAFALGSIGGAVHVAGKNLTVEPSVAKAWAGYLVANTGTSMVSNAGRGARLFGEITVPLASARIRVTPFENAKLHIAVNVFESAVIARNAVRDGLEIDWSRSLSAGVLVFVAENKRIVNGDREVGGFAIAPTIVVSSLAYDVDRVVRHEVVHVHQQWFVQETIGQPVENVIRQRLRFARRIPGWLELGVAGPGFLLLEDWVLDERGLYNLMQAEAELLERR